MGRPKGSTNKKEETFLEQIIKHPEKIEITTPISLIATNPIKFEPAIDIKAEIEAQNKKIDSLVEIVSKLAESLPAKKEEVKPQVDLPPVIDYKKEIPTAWRIKINELLGPDFKAEVNESNGGNWILKIYIPERVKRTKDGVDISTGIIRRATDISDVEKWCKLIHANIKSMFPNFK